MGTRPVGVQALPTPDSQVLWAEDSCLVIGAVLEQYTLYASRGLELTQVIPNKWKTKAICPSVTKSGMTMPFQQK